ncbi:MAG TPA: vWA domain-containing protein [Kofleriaceae bacterium]|nr:vWA domain-containing protein [Kofleriaceae bacterium]
MKARHLVLALYACAACGPSSRATPDGSVGGGDSGPTTDAGECHDVIDVVFVLDTSSSMGFVLSQLESQIAQVVTASNMLAPDAHFGLIVFQDNHALDATGPLEAGKVHVAADTLQTAFRYYRNNFTNFDRNPGDGINGLTTQNPICEENSLDALHAAAATFPWRPNATRVIILATDDTFLERADNYGDRDGDGLTNKTDFPREGNYPAAFTMAETVTALRDAKIRVFSFSRITQPGIFDRCGTGRRLPWEDITDGWTTPYNGQPPFPVQTDGQNFDLDQVKNGSLSLAATINQVVLDSYCVPPIL